jgi:hypothetical protein
VKSPRFSFAESAAALAVGGRTIFSSESGDESASLAGISADARVKCATIGESSVEATSILLSSFS